MTGGSNIRAIGSQEAQEKAQAQPTDSTQEEPLSLEEEWEENWEGEPTAAPRFAWVLPTVAVLAIAGWSGFYAWALQTELLQGGTPQQWIGWIVNWSIPVLLVVALWLLGMRHSLREANRFGDVAATLSRESAELENRLLIINRELSLAREFLGSQSLELESLGRIAGDRLSQHAEQLQSLIHDNGAQIDSIASVSDTALTNMQKLRDDLPVIANSARDVSNQVGNAGRTAHEQIDKLVAGFDRLNEFGKASERQVVAFSAKVGSTLEAFQVQVDRLDELAEARFEALKSKSEEFRTDLDSREVDALAAMRHRADELRAGISALREEIVQEEEKSLSALRTRMESLKSEHDSLGEALHAAEVAAFAALGEAKDRLHGEIIETIGKLDHLDEKAMTASRERVRELKEEAGRFDDLLAARDIKFNEEIARRQDAFDTRESQASEVLAQRLAELDEALAERRETQVAETARLVDHGERIAAKVSELSELFERVAEQASDAETRVGTGLEGLSQRLNDNRANLAETEKALSTLTEASIRLLEIIQSGAKQSRDDLPKAIEVASNALSGVEERAMSLRETVGATTSGSEDLSNYLITAQDTVASTSASLDQLTARLASQSDDTQARLAALNEALAELDGSSTQLAEKTQDQLSAAIGGLLEASRSAFAMLESSAEDVVGKAADQIGALASESVQRGLRANTAEAIREMEEATARATGSTRDTVIQLRDQLSKVNELTTNIEQRVSRARELAQEQVDNDFARRMALITESLNSNAIDIAQALSTEVSDTAWAAYLKGDRGIFTRRAVSLVDNSEIRSITDLYQADDSFRDHVNRYIHDFEAMLRSLLSTRDGNALSVTMLGSDMGKLYVALAQAIERFRN